MSKILNKSASLRLLAAELSDYDPEHGSMVKSFIEHYIGLDKNEYLLEEFNKKVKQTGDMWNSLPQVYHPDIRRQRDGLKERYTEAYNRLKEITKYNDLTLYRGLATTEDVIDRIIKGERFDLGKHWTLVKGKAFDFASPNAAGPVGLIFTGTADVSGLNILKTLKQMVEFPEEEEIQLIYGTPIKVYEIEMRKGGLYHHDDMVRINEKVNKINPANMKFIASVEKTADSIKEYDPDHGDMRKIMRTLNHFLPGTNKYTRLVYQYGKLLTYREVKNLIKDKEINLFPSSIETDQDIINSLVSQYRNLYKQVQRNIKNGKVTVYRGIELNRKEFSKLVDGKLKLGKYWSTDKNVAKSFATTTGLPQYNEIYTTFIISGEIEESNINWGVSFYHRMQPDYAAEKEIYIPKGTPIDIINVTFFSTPEWVKPYIKNNSLVEKLNSLKITATQKTAEAKNAIDEYDPKYGDPNKISRVIVKSLETQGPTAREYYRDAFNAEGKDNPFPKVDDSDVTSTYKLYHSVWGNLFDRIEENGTVRIYRSMQVDVDTLLEIRNSGTNLGIYWSYRRESAKVYEADDASGSIVILLSGTVNANDVDWGISLVHNMSIAFAHENEIRVPRGTTIKLDAVDVLDVLEPKEVGIRLAQLGLLEGKNLSLGPDDLKNYDSIEYVVDVGSLMDEIRDVYADTFIKNFDIQDIYYKDHMALYFMVQNFNPIAQILMRDIPGDKWTEIAYDPEKAFPYFLAAEKDIKDYLRREDPKEIIEEFRDKYHFNDLFIGATDAVREKDLMDDIEQHAVYVDESHLQKLMDVEFKHEYTATKNNS